MKRENDRLASHCGHDCTAHASAAATGQTTNHDIGRRTFLVQSAIMAAATALAACGTGADTTAPTLDAGSSIVVSDYPVLGVVGGVALVSVGAAQLAIVRTGASTFVALSRICPHQGGVVNEIASGFLCPLHGAQFTTTGTWAGGQRTSSLHAYTTSYDATSGVLSIS